MKALVALAIVAVTFSQEVPQPPERIMVWFTACNPQSPKTIKISSWMTKIKFKGKERLVEIPGKELGLEELESTPLFLDSFAPVFEQGTEQLVGMSPNIHELLLEAGTNKLSLFVAENRLVITPKLSNLKDLVLVVQYVNFVIPLKDTKPGIEVYVSKSPKTEEASKEFLEKINQNKPIPRGRGTKSEIKTGEKIFIAPPATRRGVAAIRIGTDLQKSRQIWEVRQPHPFMIEMNDQPLRKDAEVRPKLPPGPIARTN